MDAFSRQWVRRIPDVNKPIERAGEASARCAAVIRAAGVTNDFETTAVVALDQSGDQKPDRMRAEVGGQIAEADSLAWPRFRGREGGPSQGELGGNLPSTRELLFGRRLRAPAT
jgi:hypothetical protein